MALDEKNRGYRGKDTRRRWSDSPDATCGSESILKTRYTRGLAAVRQLARRGGRGRVLLTALEYSCTYQEYSSSGGGVVVENSASRAEIGNYFIEAQRRRHLVGREIPRSRSLRGAGSRFISLGKRDRIKTPLSQLQNRRGALLPEKSVPSRKSLERRERYRGGNRRYYLKIFRKLGSEEKESGKFATLPPRGMGLMGTLSQKEKGRQSEIRSLTLLEGGLHFGGIGILRGINKNHGRARMLDA